MWAEPEACVARRVVAAVDVVAHHASGELRCHDPQSVFSGVHTDTGDSADLWAPPSTAVAAQRTIGVSQAIAGHHSECFISSADRLR